MHKGVKLKALTIIILIGFGLSIQNSYFLNFSPSMPLGLYKKLNSNTFKRGDIVAFCLDKKIAKLGRNAGYLLPGLRCYPSAPLIKQIIAVPGDNVVLEENFIIVNGKKSNFKTYKADSLSRTISSILRGRYQKTKGYWLIGTHDIKSWDSRYWGKVKYDQIIAKFKHSPINTKNKIL